MMNLVDLQDKLRNLSQEQLVQQMQAPTGDVPQFLLLSEITRRKKMRDSFAQEQGKDESTVAQDAVAAAGMPAGFAAQMAGAMAPQTDVQGNTGAMPQAQMTQQGAAPVPGMADGGIVALRDGGGVNVPELVVRNGRMFRRDRETGELVPVLGGDTGGMSEPRPSPRVMDPSLDADLFGPRMGDVSPTVGGELREPLPTVGGISQPADLEMSPLADQFAPVPPLPAESVSGAPAVAPSVSGGSGGRRSRETPEVLTPMEGLLGLLPERSSVGVGRGRNPPPESSVETPESTGDTVVTAEDILDATPTVANIATVGPSGGGAGGGGASGGGGGIAGLAGAAQTAPSTYEQELLDMLGAREKRAQQDKWLALAQFGLQLMSSKEPTIGGAIGEAGAPALDALRSSRETYDADRLGLLNTLEQYRSGQAQLALQQQAARARGAAGGGGSAQPIGELSAGQGRLLSQYNNEIERLNETLSGVAMDTTPAMRSDAAARLKALTAERNALLSGLTGVPFGGGASSSGMMFDVTN